MSGNSSIDEPKLPPVDPNELCFEPFLETRKVQQFHCGREELDNFLNTEEVENYQREGLGRSTLVYYRGDVVGYFTTSSESLRVEYMQSYRSFSKVQELKVNDVPGVKIGRLAVHSSWQRRGIGKHIFKYIHGMAQEVTSKYFAIRIIFVEAYKESIPFYKKMDFDFAYKTRKERQRMHKYGTRTMFFSIL